jgi:hypothetical protein
MLSFRDEERAWKKLALLWTTPLVSSQSRLAPSTPLPKKFPRTFARWTVTELVSCDSLYAADSMPQQQSEKWR